MKKVKKLKGEKLLVVLLYLISRSRSDFWISTLWTGEGGGYEKLRQNFGGVWNTYLEFWGGYEKYVEFLEISSTPLPGIKNDHPLSEIEPSLTFRRPL